jgi:two-component system sensor histidine kinase BaeS
VTLHSLRTKLVIANVFPALLLVPILSLYLLNTLEEFYTQEVVQGLAEQGSLILDDVLDEPAMVKDSAAAQSFLIDVARSTAARVLLLSKDGTILGSSRPEDYADKVGMRYTAKAVADALQGVPVQGTEQGLTTEVAYVVLPVRHNGAVHGVLRLSYEVEDVRAAFERLRWLVVSATMVTGLVASVLGLALSGALTSPIDRLVRSIQEIAAGNYNARVETKRQDEIGVLATAFNQMAVRLADAESARQQQLAAIVHELARPLTSMSVALEVLLDGGDANRGGTDPGAQRELLAGLGEETARLERLVNTLQSVQKQAVQHMELQCVPLSVEHLICATAAYYMPTAERDGITLVAYAPAPVARVMVDEDRMIQVLANLLDNALKFTPDGGCITVEAEDNPDRGVVCVSVADTGPGVMPDELPHIFEQFYRGERGKRPGTGGLGLGLAICRQIVAAHGGEIWVESEPGRGARFIFTLPALGDVTGVAEGGTMISAV